MKPVDIRNATWADIQVHLEGDRERVYNGLSLWGPRTTRDLAALIQADVLNVRPRVTELVQLGLARLVRKERREGVYEAIPIFEARKQLEQQSAEEAKRHGEQLQLI